MRELINEDSGLQPRKVNLHSSMERLLQIIICISPFLRDTSTMRDGSSICGAETVSAEPGCLHPARLACSSDCDHTSLENFKAHAWGLRNW